MAMATSSRLLPGLALAAALAVAGCGGATGGTGHAAPVDAFAWLRPAQPPTGWKVVRLPAGAAELAYPAGWRSIRTDPGTFSAALLGTPRPHSRLPECDATVGCRDGRQLGSIPSRPQPRRGRPKRRHGGHRNTSTLPHRHRLVCRRPLRDRIRPLPGNRVHRTRVAHHDGRRGCRPAAGLGPPRPGAAAVHRELRDLAAPAA